MPNEADLARLQAMMKGAPVVETATERPVSSLALTDEKKADYQARLKQMMGAPEPAAIPMLNLATTATPAPGDIGRPQGTSSDFHVAMPKVRTVMQDGPSAKSHQEAMALWRGRGVRFPPDDPARFNTLVTGEAVGFFQRLGFMDEGGRLRDGLSPDLFNRVKEAMAFNAAGRWSPIAPEEATPINRIAITNTVGVLQNKMMARLHELDANIAAEGGVRSVPGRYEGTDRARAARVAGMHDERLQLQQHFATLQELGSMADDPATQRVFLQTAREQAKARAFRLTQGDRRDAQADAESALLDMTTAGIPDDASVLASPRAQRIRAALATINKTDGAFVLEDFLAGMYRGAVFSHRMDRFNVPASLREQMTPEGLLAVTHPRLFGELVEARARPAAADLFKDAGREATVDELQRQTTALLEANRPAFVDELLRAGTDAVREAALNSSVAASTGSMMGDLQSGLDQTLAGVGEWINTGLPTAKKIIGGLLGAADALTGASQIAHVFGAAEVAQATEEYAARVHADTEKALLEAGVIAPEPEVGVEAAERAAAAPRADGGLTAEQRRRLFNPDGNVLKALTMALGDELPIQQQTLTETAGLSLDPVALEEFRRANTAARTQIQLNEAVLGQYTREQRDQAMMRARQTTVAKDGLGAFLESRVVSSWYWIGHEIRAFREQLKNAPEDTVALGLVTSGLGTAGTVIGRTLTGAAKKTAVARAMASAVQMDRGIGAVKELAKLDPEAVLRIRTTLAARPQQDMGDTIDLLDHIRQKRRDQLNDLSPVALGRLRQTVDDTLERVGEHLKAMEPDGFDDVLTAAGADHNIRAWAERPAKLREVVAELFRARPSDKVPMRHVLPLTARSVPDVMRRQLDELDTIRLEDVEVAPDLLDRQTATFWEKVTGKKAYRQAGGLRLTAEFFHSLRADLSTVRALTAEKRADAQDFVRYLQVKEVNRYRAFAAARAALATTDPDHARMGGLMRDALVSAQRAKGLRKSLEARSWTRPYTGLHGTSLVSRADLPSIVAYIDNRKGTDSLYGRMRKAGETRQEFDARLAGLLGLSGFRHEVARFKKDLIREYFHNRGLREADFINGEAVSARVARRQEAENRQAIAAAAKTAGVAPTDIDPDSLGLPEVYRRSDLKGKMTELERAAARERLLAHSLGAEGSETALRRLRDHAALAHDGRPGTIERIGRAIGLSNRLNTAVLLRRHELIQRAYEDLGPQERALYDAALDQVRDAGVHAKLAALRQDPRFKPILDAAGPESLDAGVQHVLDLHDDFRREILQSSRDAGIIDAPTFEKLSGPYASQKYHAFAYRGKTPRTVPQDDPLLPGMDIDELEARRHTTKYRVQVYLKDGRPIERTFDTQAKAASWLGSHWDIKKTDLKPSTTLGKNDIAAVTATGERAIIMEPVGKELAEGLGEIASGKATFLGVRNLLLNHQRLKFMNLWDQPGYAFDATEWRAYQRTPEGRSAAGQFRRLPNTDGMGKLAGKWVHTGVLREIDHWTDSRFMAEAMADAMQEVVGLRSAAANALTVTKGAALSLNSALRDAIGTVAIALNPSAIAAQWFSDLWFGGLASGSPVSYMLSGEGRRARRDALTMVYRLRFGTLGRDARGGMDGILDLLGVQGAERDAVALALRNNLLDEGVLGRAGLGGDDTAVVRNLYEATKDDKFRIAPPAPGKRARGPAKVEMSRKVLSQTLRMMEAPWKDARLTELTSRVAKWRGLLQRSDLSDKLRARLEYNIADAERLLQTQHAGGAMKLWARSVDAFSTGLGRGGQFGDRSFAAQEFYGMLGNAARIGSFLHQIRNGVNPQRAIDNVNDFMQTYGGVPKFVKRLARSVPAAPVLSFKYEAARVGLNAIRRRPGLFAGMAMSLPALNTVAIAGGGMNPEQVIADMRQQSGTLPWWVSMMEGLVVPAGRGTYAHVPLPGLNLTSSILANPFGIGDNIVAPWANDKTLGPVGRAGAIAASSLASMLAGGPLLTAAGKILNRTDPLTGQEYESGTAAILSAAGGLAQTFVPAWTPFVGGHAQRVERTIGGRPAAYSGRKQGLFEAVVQNWLGVRLRGAGSLLPEQLRSAADVLGRTGAVLTGAAPWRLPHAQQVDVAALGEREKLSLAIITSAPLDVEGTGTQHMNWSAEFQDFRRASAMLADPNPVLQKEGAALRDDAIDRYSRRMELIRRTDHGTTREVSTRELANMLVREQELNDPLLAFGEYSLPRKADILQRMLVFGASDETIKRLAHLTIFTEKNGLRSPASPAEVEDAQRILLRAGQTGSPAQKAAVGSVLAVMGLFKAKADVRQTYKEVLNDKFGAAMETVIEARKQ